MYHILLLHSSVIAPPLLPPFGCCEYRRPEHGHQVSLRDPAFSSFGCKLRSGIAGSVALAVLKDKGMDSLEERRAFI